MNAIKIKETLLVSSIALALSACGGNSDSPLDENVAGVGDVGAYQLKNLPSQRSIDIPKSLLAKRADSNQTESSGSMMSQVDSDGGVGPDPLPSNTTIEPNFGIVDGAGPISIGPDGNGQNISFGYLKIKDSAFAVELSRLEQEREVLMLDAVWDDIKSRCDGTALSEACSIPENEISLNVTEALVKANDEINQRIDDLYVNQYGDIYGGALYGAGTGIAVSGENSAVSSAAVDPQVMPEPHMDNMDGGSSEDYQVMPEPQLDEDFPMVKDEPWVEPQPEFVVGAVIPLGSISYIQYGSDEDFQYEVEIEPEYIEPVYTTMEIGVDGTIVEFKGSVIASERFFVAWSHDEKRVKSGFRYEDDQSNYSYTFSYLDQGDKKIATIRDESSFDMGDEFGQGKFSSTISLSEKEGDPDGMVNIRFDIDNFMPNFESKTSSTGRVSDSGGFLRTEGKFINTFSEETEESVFNTEEIFDGKGNLLKYRWCDAGCDQDKNWKDGNMILAMPEPIGDFNFEESEFYVDGEELELIENSLPSFGMMPVEPNGGIGDDGGMDIFLYQ